MNDNERDFCGHLQDCQIGDVVTHLDHRRWKVIGRIAEHWQLQEIGEGFRRIIMVHNCNEEFYSLGHNTIEEILEDG